MAEDLQKLTVQIEADISRLERNLSQANRAIDNKLGKVDRRLTRSERRFQQWGRRIATSIQIGMVAATAYAGREALRTADRIDILQDRIKDATKESGDFEKVWAGISETAIETGGAIEGNIELVQRLTTASKDLGGTNDQILLLNDTVQKLGIIGGSSTAALSAGTMQLAQGLGAGIFRAEEFNSVLENTPAVANAIAKSLGKSTAELRNMVLAGELTSRMVFDALLDSADEVEQRYSEIPPRLSRAWGGFLNAISLQVGELNNELGTTELIASKIEEITQGISKGWAFEGLPGDNAIETWLNRRAIANDQATELELIEEKINELYEERSKLQEDIATHSGFIDEYSKNRVKGYEQEIAEIDTQINLLNERNRLLNEPGGNEQTQSGITPDPRATPDYIQPTLRDLNRDRPDNPDQVALDRSEAINQSISERTALEAHNADMIGRSAAEVERMNLEFEINRELAKDRIVLSDEQRAAMKVQLDLYQQELEMTEEINNELRRKQEQMELLEQASDRFAEDMGRALVDSIAAGENALTSLTRAFKAALIRMAADALIINPMKQLFSPSGGNLFGNLFGGFYADGGNPPVGKMSVVGERGPELFIPKTAGTIVSNDNFAKMGSNIKIVNQTTGRIDSVQKTMTRGEVQLILREELPGAMAGQVAAPNSSFNKTFRANNSVNRKF